MVSKSDFSLKLLSTLTAFASVKEDHDEVSSPQQSGLFMKAALALRAWYRHMALLERPEMVVQDTGSRFEVYGGTFVERQADGTLKLENQRRPENGAYVEVASLGPWLARQARQQVQSHYHGKAQDLVRSQELDANMTRKLISALEQANEYVSYKLTVCWWRRASTLSSDGRVLGKLLWDSGVLDREAFSLAVRVVGFRFTVPDFNSCAAHKEALMARVKEAPHMAPWLMESNYFASTLQVQDTVWKDLKAQFLSLGGTPQTWKWLCNQGHTWFKFFRLQQNDVMALNYLSSLQVGKAPLHMGFMGNLRSRLGYGNYQDVSKYLDVFKAAVVAFKKRKLKLADFGEYNLIFDWLHRVPEASTKGATWASLMRKQHAWHMEFARQEMLRRKEEGGCLGWAPFVQSLVQKDLDAVSLNTSDDLWEEGTAMDHCVGGYDQQCYANVSRIYSIRRAGERVATLEIRKVGGKLTIGQLYGYHNRRITDKAVNLFAKRVLSECRKAPEPSTAENRVIREPKKPVRKLAPQPVQANHEELEEIPF